MEAFSGKNPVSHVGKIYALFSFHLAQALYARTSGIQEVYVRLCSQIGLPVSKPALSAVTIIPARGADLTTLRLQATSLFQDELARINEFKARLISSAWALESPGWEAA